MNHLCDYALTYSNERLNVKNDHNGRAYIGCVIFNRHQCYSYGINQYNIDFKFNTIHAEVDAIIKLKRKYKPKKVHMIVFRINRDNHKLCNAKPCIHCINYMQRNLRRKNYILKNNRCYYTDEQGNINYIKI